mmetsp:Transcript_7987/g.22111  ORF Transcript_7987/g.22111 Transcript_7987/m.22111 type:complete len:234 (-) Transcript_7987:1760-2461(-)
MVASRKGTPTTTTRRWAPRWIRAWRRTRRRDLAPHPGSRMRRRRTRTSDRRRPCDAASPSLPKEATGPRRDPGSRKKTKTKAPRWRRSMTSSTSPSREARRTRPWTSYARSPRRSRRRNDPTRTARRPPPPAPDPESQRTGVKDWVKDNRRSPRSRASARPRRRITDGAGSGGEGRVKPRGVSGRRRRRLWANSRRRRLARFPWRLRRCARGQSPTRPRPGRSHHPRPPRARR